jgi:hypothetical protein
VLGATVPVPTLEGSVSMKVPAGFQQGQKLRVRGKGLPAGGAKRGDLYGAADKGTWVGLLQPPTEGGLTVGFQGLKVSDHICVKLIRTDVQRGFIDFACA